VSRDCSLSRVCQRRVAAVGILAVLALGTRNGSAAQTERPPVDLDRQGELGALPIPPEELAARTKRHTMVPRYRGSPVDQVLFGDLHVHTTYSLDAFLRALPMVLGADGATPPVDACNYARYVAQLDFFANTDHAEEIVPENWMKTVNALRLCARVSQGTVTDLVPFLGFEWSQVGKTAATHWGHDNTIFKWLDIGRTPGRPIRAPASDNEGIATIPTSIVNGEPSGTHRFYDAYNAFATKVAGVAKCPPGSPLQRDDCQEVAANPGELLRTLRRWGLPHIVIPHGSSWGLYTPPDATWDNELTPEEYDPDVETLIEVYSGHGSSEVYLPFGEFGTGATGERVCEPPTSIHLPECWQAGEIIRRRCESAGNSAAECDARAVEARRRFLQMPGVTGWTIVPNSTVEDWLDAGQARDMFMPAFNYRPLKSVQAGLALTNFDDPIHPFRFHWGFVGSTDTHTARPGHGFKDVDRLHNVDLWVGLRSTALVRQYLTTDAPPGTPLDQARAPASIDLNAFGGGPLELERLGSFLSLGGLVAVHAVARTREAIWDALERREVYATSGVRILLRFDLTNWKSASGMTAVQPMGSIVRMHESPQFRVEAIGSEKQRPGCPDFIRELLQAQQLSRLAHNECYYPTDERYEIRRIEVIRIRPQSVPGEDIRDLIEDPWKTIECPPKSTDCRAEFSDDRFVRDSVYYVRAIEEPTPMINGKNLRTRFDENGQPLAVSPCYMDPRTDPKDDCLSSVDQRAWSSPIFVDRAR
jgi:hypothetical protein